MLRNPGVITMLPELTAQTRTRKSVENRMIDASPSFRGDAIPNRHATQSQAMNQEPLVCCCLASIRLHFDRNTMVAMPGRSSINPGNAAIRMIEAQRMPLRSTRALYDHKPLLYNFFHGRRDTLRYACPVLPPLAGLRTHVSPPWDIDTKQLCGRVLRSVD
jgi:hypothetical protein